MTEMMTPDTQTLRGHLQQVHELVVGPQRKHVAGLSVYELLVKYGVEFDQTMYGIQITDTLREVHDVRPQHCYNNCFNLVASNRESWAYVEGYAARGPIGVPMSHAWMINRNTLRVIDPTWGHDRETMYLGIPIRYEFLLESVLANRDYPGIFFPSGTLNSLLAGTNADTACDLIADKDLLEKINWLRQEVAA